MVLLVFLDLNVWVESIMNLRDLRFGLSSSVLLEVDK